MPGRFISVKETVRKICLSKTELYDRLRAGTFPQPVSLGPRKVVFFECDIDAWMQSQIEDCHGHAASRRSRARKAVRSRRDRKDLSRDS
jgi:prophage regulatory protein